MALGKPVSYANPLSNSKTPNAPNIILLASIISMETAFNVGLELCLKKVVALVQLTAKTFQRVAPNVQVDSHWRIKSATQIKAVKPSIKPSVCANNASQALIWSDINALSQAKRCTTATFTIIKWAAPIVNMASFHTKANAFYLTIFKPSKQESNKWVTSFNKKSSNMRLLIRKTQPLKQRLYHPQSQLKNHLPLIIAEFQTL
jgi:hypothetical protein